jgi:L-rhamnose mutarotase
MGEQSPKICSAPRRLGGAIQLRPNFYNLYTQLHDHVWDEVLERLYKSNIRNYTIYYHPETNILFSHMEWIGATDDPDRDEKHFQEDMDAIATDPVTKEWWSYCEPCQKPFSQWPIELLPPSQHQDSTKVNHDWWAPLICLCHCGYWPVKYANAMRDPNFVPQNPFHHTSTREKPPTQPFEELHHVKYETKYNYTEEVTSKNYSLSVPRRLGGAIQLRPELRIFYTQLYDKVWDEILERLFKSNIRNYTIYYHHETNILFSHMEWIGATDDPDRDEKRFQEDMDAIATDPVTKEWWSYCEPCQKPFSQWPTELLPPSQHQDSTKVNHDWWAPLICLCHCGYWPVKYANSMRDPNFVPQNPFHHTSTRENPPKLPHLNELPGN